MAPEVVRNTDGVLAPGQSWRAVSGPVLTAAMLLPKPLFQHESTVGSSR